MKASTKKLFFYISVCLVLCYFIFVLLAYNSGILTSLYTLKECGMYYIFAYTMLSAVAYFIDIQTRKEPAFLTLFCLPAYTYLFMLGIMFIAGISWDFMIVLTLVMFLVYILGYLCYKKWIEKILLIKNGYENILFVYIVIHLCLALFITFRMTSLI